MILCTVALLSKSSPLSLALKKAIQYTEDLQTSTENPTLFNIHLSPLLTPPSSIYIYTSFQPSAKRTRIPMAFKIRFSPQDEVSPQGTWKSSICRAKNDPCDQQHSKMNLRERAQRWSTAQIKSGISEDALGILADLPRMGHEP